VNRLAKLHLPFAVAATALALALALALAPGEATAQLAVRGGVVHTLAGPPIEDGVVLVGADGRIQAVGPASQVSIPPGVRTVEAAVVTPGLVDGHTVVGLAGYLNQPHDQDQLDRTDAIQPTCAPSTPTTPGRSWSGTCGAWGSPRCTPGTAPVP
jgi:predicted amidohydrolase YtcJ